MEIPPEALSDETLRRIIEEFVLREGTDYGDREYSLDEKVQHVMGQLRARKIVITYNEQDGSVTLSPRGR